MAAANDPRRWSYSNPPIQNNGTNVDARLSTITADNPRGYKKLSTTSTDPIVSQLYYAIDNNGNVTYANLVFDATNPNAPGIVRRQYNNIQEIADSGQIGYTPQTTAQIKNSLATNLKQETENKILNTPQSPASTTNPNEQNLTPNTPAGNPENTPAGTQPNTETIAAAPTQQFSQNSPVPKGSPVYYPIDIAETGQDRIKFTAVELSSRTIAAPTEYTPVAGDVYISIQGPIQDQSSVSWGDSKVTAMDLGLAEVSQTIIEGGGDVGAGMDKAGQLIKSALKSLDGKEAQLFSALAASNMDIFTRGTQLTFNPNLELLFREPQLRPFNFQFKLSARSEEESKVIKKIIKYFKYHMAVKNAEGFLFLKAPDVFWIEYQKGNSNIHPSLNLIAPGEVKTKACALQSFNVDYTPLGTYMTYDDQEASMIQYNLSMNFTEITPVYQSDYDKGLGLNHSIGY